VLSDRETERRRSRQHTRTTAMAFLFLNPPSKTRDASEKATALGLHYLRASPSVHRYVPIVHLAQPGHQCYVRNFSSFMAAAAKQETVKLLHSAHRCIIPDDFFPMPLPPLSVSFMRPNDPTVQQILSAHQHTETRISNSRIFLFSEPSDDLIRTLTENEHLIVTRGVQVDPLA
jgi:hypothetical protein